MAYLEDYLRVLPKADTKEIETLLARYLEENKSTTLEEEAFEQALLYLIKGEDQQTKKETLSKTLESAEFNAFYQNVAKDLAQLFLEQRLFEGVSANYARIFDGNLDEIRNHLLKLKQKINELELNEKGQEGVVFISYSFEPNLASKYLEQNTNDGSMNFFLDRDGKPLMPIGVSRRYHHSFASLSQTKSVDLLKDDKGQTNGKLRLLSYSPYALSFAEEESLVDKAIDGNDQTFWYSVALKPNNSLEEVTINPEELS